VALNKFLFPRNKSYVIKPHLAWQRFSQSNITGRYAYSESIIPDEYKQPITTENTTDSTNSNLINIIMEGETRISELDREVYLLKQSLAATNSGLSCTRNMLDEINNSMTWRIARRFHKLIDTILPLGTKRRQLVKRIFFWFTRQPIAK
jgi:hypothetical protein